MNNMSHPEFFLKRKDSGFFFVKKNNPLNFE
jgi:hypothetical protein